MAKPKTPASIRGKILDPILVEVGTASRDEKIHPKVTSLLDRPKRSAKLPDVVKWLREVSAGIDADVKALAERGMLRDPLSTIQAGKPKFKTVSRAAAKALPQARPLYAIAMPEVAAAVLDILKETGLIKDGVMRIGPLLVDPQAGVSFLLEALKYSAPRDAAAELRRVNSRGGVFYEALMPYHADVVKAETDVACRNVAELIRARRAGSGRPAAQIRGEIAAAQETIRGRMAGFAGGAVEDHALESTPDKIAILENGPVGENLWLIRLTGMRDMDGKLVADHFRALVSLEGKTVKLIPVGIGESKFQSGYDRIIPQLIETFKRVREGVSARNLPAGADVQVQWGSDVVAIIQSEKEPPRGHSRNIEQNLAKAAGKGKLEVNLIPMTDQQGATDAREVVFTILEETQKRK